MMSRKRHTTEQITHKLRDAEVELSKGRAISEVSKQLSITDQTFMLLLSSHPPRTATKPNVISGIRLRHWDVRAHCLISLGTNTNRQMLQRYFLFTFWRCKHDIEQTGGFVR